MSSEQHSPLGLERMLFFSDAVFAIAITLLALELKVPGIESMHEDSLLLEGLIRIARTL